MSYYAILTNIGKEKIINAVAGGAKVSLTKMYFGDGGGRQYDPKEDQTALKNKVAEVELKSVAADPNDVNIISIEAVIPYDIGGFWIREAGVYDDAGALIAVASLPDTYKPLMTDGAGKDLVVRMNLAVSNSSAVTIMVNPNVTVVTFNDLEHGVTEQGYNYTITRHKDGTRVLEMWGTIDTRDVAEIHLPVNVVPGKSTMSLQVINNPHWIKPEIQSLISDTKCNITLYDNKINLLGYFFITEFCYGNVLQIWKNIQTLMNDYTVFSLANFKGYCYMAVLDIVTEEYKVIKTKDFYVFEEIEYLKNKCFSISANKEKIIAISSPVNEEIVSKFVFESSNGIDWEAYSHDDFNFSSSVYFEVICGHNGFLLYNENKIFIKKNYDDDWHAIFPELETVTSKSFVYVDNRYVGLTGDGKIYISYDLDSWEEKTLNADVTIQNIILCSPTDEIYYFSDGNKLYRCNKDFSDVQRIYADLGVDTFINVLLVYNGLPAYITPSGRMFSMNMVNGNFTPYQIVSNPPIRFYEFIPEVHLSFKLIGVLA